MGLLSLGNKDWLQDYNSDDVKHQEAAHLYHACHYNLLRSQHPQVHGGQADREQRNTWSWRQWDPKKPNLHFLLHTLTDLAPHPHHRSLGDWQPDRWHSYHSGILPFLALSYMNLRIFLQIHQSRKVFLIILIYIYIFYSVMVGFKVNNINLC